MERRVINSGEVARPRGLVLLRPQRKAVHVDTLVRVARVGLVRLDPREVGSFALREAVLAVELELRGDDGVLSPAVHVEGGLGENERSGIGDAGVDIVVIGILEKRSNVRSSNTGGKGNLNAAEVNLIVRVGRSVPVSSETGLGEGSRLVIEGTGIREEAVGINVSTAVRRNSGRAAERVDGVRESVNRISVVEGLSSKNLEEKRVAREGRAIIDVLIGLNNPNKLLDGVVEVELDLVGTGTDGLVTGELELGDEVLVRVLGHAATLIRIEEDIVDVEGGGNEGLIVGNRGRDGLSNRILGTRGVIRALMAVERGDGPEALINRANIKVDLDLVVLERNQGKGKSGVGAEPELEGNIERRLRESVAGSANLAGGQGVARSIDLREGRIRDECELRGVSNHLEVTALLLAGHRELVPDVHPVTILAIDALASNLNLNLGNELLSGEVQPTGINAGVLSGAVVAEAHKLVNLGESNLKVGAVSKISVPANHALDTTTEIGLSVESLFDRLNREVCVPAVRHFPKSYLRITRKVNILCAIGH